MPKNLPVDTKAERFVQQVLDRLMARRTTFVIAHRFITVQRADQILVFAGGIVQHDTLTNSRTPNPLNSVV